MERRGLWPRRGVGAGEGRGGTHRAGLLRQDAQLSVQGGEVTSRPLRYMAVTYKTGMMQLRVNESNYSIHYCEAGSKILLPRIRLLNHESKNLKHKRNKIIIF